MSVSYATRAMLRGILKANAIRDDRLDTFTDEVCAMIAKEQFLASLGLAGCCKGPSGEQLIFIPHKGTAE